MLTVALLLLLLSALVVLAVSVGLCWLMLGEAGEEGVPARRSPSLTQVFARELEARQLWRALSSWIADKPLQLEHRRGPDRS